jgi:hypothetical protein
VPFLVYDYQGRQNRIAQQIERRIVIVVKAYFFIIGGLAVVALICYLTAG